MNSCDFDVPALEMDIELGFEDIAVVADNDSYYFRNFRHHPYCMMEIAVVADYSTMTRAMNRAKMRVEGVRVVYIYVTLNHPHLFRSHHHIHDHLLDSDTCIVLIYMRDKSERQRELDMRDDIQMYNIFIYLECTSAKRENDEIV